MTVRAIVLSARRMARAGLAMLLSVLLVLPGCASNQFANTDDPNDPCRPERAALVSTGDYFAQDIITGAAVGAVAGGLIGGLASGNMRGAAAGALAGGALGALGGYWKARQEQYANDQAALIRTVYGDIQRDNATIDRTQAAFNRLVACRRNDAARIRGDYRTGRITREQAAAAMAELRSRSDTDLQIARSISGHIEARSNDFSYANNQVRSTTVRTGRGRGGGGGGATQVQAATSTNLAKREQFEQSIARAQTTRSSFELS